MVLRAHFGRIDEKRKATLDSVLSTVERGFAAVADDITDIKSKMATKDDIVKQLVAVGKAEARTRREQPVRTR